MKKIIIILSIASISAMTGCKSVNVTRNASSIATIKYSDGSVEVVKDSTGNPIILDGGWEVDYFQHWNWQKFDSMSATAGKDVTLSINGYDGGAAASNLTAIVSSSFSGGAQLATAIGDAYVKIAGGGAQAATLTNVATKVYQSVKSGGGDSSQATVNNDTTLTGSTETH